MGGECNYLLRIDGATKQLKFIPDQTWKSQLMMGWSEEAISRLLDTAQASLKQAASQLRLDVEVSYTTQLASASPLQFAGAWATTQISSCPGFQISSCPGFQSNQPRFHRSHFAADSPCRHMPSCVLMLRYPAAAEPSFHPA